MMHFVKYRSISDVILKVLAVEKLRMEKSCEKYLVLIINFYFK